MNPKTTLRLAAVLGALSVGIGAFGAHGLAAFLAQTGRAATFETAVRYQFYHTLALLLVGMLQLRYPRVPALGRVALCFVVGMLIFSGSLYALVFSGIKWLGAITPLGGVSMIVGWLWLAVAVSSLPTEAETR